MPNLKVKGYIAASKEDQSIKESFKGNIIDIPVTYPKELGAKHPFDFEAVERVYKKNGFVAGAINKYVDNIVGEFTIKVKNPNVRAILDQFIYNTDFATVLRAWIREAFIKGNGFMEIDLQNQEIRVLNGNNMYVLRDDIGVVQGYKQWIPYAKGNRMYMRKVNEFEPKEIAHLTINQVADEPYGLGIIWPNERAIENMILDEQDLRELMSRKAGAPIHVKVGIPGEAVQPNVIDDVKNKLQYLNNSHNWVTDANVEMSVLQFGELGKSLADHLNYILHTLYSGLEVPEVLMGSGQLNEGIAKVQLESWQRKISAIQDEIESIIEEKIFKPLLIENGFDIRVEFVWNLPGESEINDRITKITELLKAFGLSPQMKAYLEIELARLLNFEGADKILDSPEEAEQKAEQDKQMQFDNQQKIPPKENKERKQEETKIPQPEIPGAKPNAKEEFFIKIRENAMTEIAETDIQIQNMNVQEFVNLKEQANFNYSDYLIRILKILKTDEFTNLKAITEQDVADGLLPETEVEKLRTVLKNGFKKNQTIREIEDEIRSRVDIKDRIKEGTTVLSAEQRPIVIARTETVRLANEGLIDLFKENKVEKVRWLSAMSDRTCIDCEDLNGRIYEINNLTEQPPLHVNCRCSLLSVIE